MKTCLNCKLLVKQDTGYSNYTVEGTDVYCGVNKHPVSAPVELPYDVHDSPRAARWGYAQAALQCDWFVEGAALAHIDVDREDEPALRIEKQLAIVGGLTPQHAQAYALGLWEPEVTS